MKTKLITLLAGVVVGASLALLLKPPVESTKVQMGAETTQVEVGTKEVRIIERPDGTKETTIVENYVLEAKGSEYAEVEIIKPVAPRWAIGLSAGLVGSNSYRMSVERRIIGNLYVGGYATTEKEVGLSLTLLF